jgi:hypothetical protein
MAAIFDEDVKTTRNYVHLMKTVVEHSKSSIVDVAITEWYVISGYDAEPQVRCLCGQPNCVDVYTIKNFFNNNELSPIGNECMKYFELSPENTKIFEALSKWRNKIYNNIDLEYHGAVFHEIIKDVAYIRSIDFLGNKKEHHRLVEYAKAVWAYKPPPPPKLYALRLSKPQCNKCVEQIRKGFKKCYDCFTENAPKSKCLKCEQQQKKGYPRCYGCNMEKKNALKQKCDEWCAEL